MKRAQGLIMQNASKLAAVLLAHPRTLAPAAFSPTNFFPRSLILRLPRRSSGCSPPHHSAAMAARNKSSDASTDLDILFKQKQMLRNRVKKDLKAMDPVLRSEEDNAIQSIVLEAPWFRSCKRLCAYISCGALREVDTSKVLAHILHNATKDGKKLYVPRVEDKNRHMRMLNITSVNDLILSSMNILEPDPNDSDGNEREDVMLADKPVDLFLLPGLAFDRSGRRLGRGGGYYDNLLMHYKELVKVRKWKQPLLVAMSYSVQILDDEVIPLTPNDVFVDVLVSPSGVIPINTAVLERFC